jgi:Cd2+-exporting ATPase
MIENHVGEIECYKGKNDGDSCSPEPCAGVLEEPDSTTQTRCSKSSTTRPPAPTEMDSTIKSCCTGEQVRRLNNDSCAFTYADDEKRNCTSLDAGSVIIQIDPEGQSTAAASITLSVQGMTCTGCEKNLYKTLNSYPEISNIKTSLLFAQAEFNLRNSTALNPGNVARIIAKKTGFVCSRVTHVGGEIDLIVADNLLDSLRDRPVGISDVVAIGRDRVRVSYEPRDIGARDLLSDPFFRNAKLAPACPPPLVAYGKAHVRHEFLMTLLSAILTTPVLVLSYAPLSDQKVTYGGVCLGLASFVQIIIGGPFYPRAFKSLVFSRLIEMDMLVVLSTTTAYIYSVIAYSFLVARKPLSTPEFFETSTLLVTLIMVGRTVSAYARQKAVESISIESRQEPKATIVHSSGEVQEIDARLLQYGDMFQVFPEATVVTDGVVVEGESEMDESLITGESTLIAKKPGVSVVAGSINHSGTLLVKLHRLPCDNTIKRIGAMVDEATSSKPKVQEIADQVAGYFVPTILAITLIVFAIWVAIGKAIQHQTTTTALITAMTYAISVLIVSCPCAIGLAVPMVAVIAGGVGAQHGLVLKSAESLEVGRKISHVIFDKTGTLTEGKLSVVGEEYLNCEPEPVRAIILGIASTSKHPVSAAVASYIESNTHEVEPAPVKGVTSVFGSGIEAMCNGTSIRAGNPYWLGVQDAPSVYALLQRGLTIFCVTINNELTAVFGLQDKPRTDAVYTIKHLKSRGITVSLISGDNENAVNFTARQLGISATHTHSRCSPEDKKAYVKSLLLSTGNTVLFCGDGTNDAIALAQASIGMHINQGTDVAQSAAGVILMRPSLKGILTLIDLSKAFYNRVVFNFVWSFVYNLFAILLAAGVFPRARIEPRYAGLGELCSVLPIIAVAMGLRLKKF